MEEGDSDALSSPSLAASQPAAAASVPSMPALPHLSPPPPIRPYSEYNLFFRIERLRLIQTIGSVDDDLLETFAPLDHEDPIEFPRPAKYATVRCPPYWYSIILSKTSERIGHGGTKRRKHRKTSGKIDFKTQARTISANWKNIDAETLAYIRGITKIELEDYERRVEEYCEKYGRDQFLKATINPHNSKVAEAAAAKAKEKEAAKAANREKKARKKAAAKGGNTAKDTAAVAVAAAYNPTEEGESAKAMTMASKEASSEEGQQRNEDYGLQQRENTLQIFDLLQNQHQQQHPQQFYSGDDTHLSPSSRAVLLTPDMQSISHHRHHPSQLNLHSTSSMQHQVQGQILAAQQHAREAEEQQQQQRLLQQQQHQSLVSVDTERQYLQWHQNNMSQHQPSPPHHHHNLNPNTQQPPLAPNASSPLQPQSMHFQAQVQVQAQHEHAHLHYQQQHHPEHALFMAQSHPTADIASIQAPMSLRHQQQLYNREADGNATTFARSATYPSPLVQSTMIQNFQMNIRQTHLEEQQRWQQHHQRQQQRQPQVQQQQILGQQLQQELQRQAAMEDGQRRQRRDFLARQQMLEEKQQEARRLLMQARQNKDGEEAVSTTRTKQQQQQPHQGDREWRTSTNASTSTPTMQRQASNNGTSSQPLQFLEKSSPSMSVNSDGIGSEGATNNNEIRKCDDHRFQKQQMHADEEFECWAKRQKTQQHQVVQQPQMEALSLPPSFHHSRANATAAEAESESEAAAFVRC